MRRALVLLALLPALAQAQYYKPGFGYCPAGYFVQSIPPTTAITCAVPVAVADWNTIINKPLTFPATVPVASASALSPAGLTSQYWRGDNSWSAPAWGDLTGVPATFPATVPVSTASALFANGANCAANRIPLGVDTVGAAEGCYQLSLNGLANPTGDKTFTFPSGRKTLWEFSGGTDYAFSIHGTGAFSGTGDLVHIHLQGTSVTPGSDALHVEFDDSTITGLRVTAPTAGSDAFNTNGKVTAGSFVGPLTGAVTGNASTATQLAADPADCSAGQAPLGITATGAVNGCFTPPGTYSLPAASTTLGGVKLASACAAGNHISAIGVGGELTCTADAGGGGGAPTTSQYWVGAADAGLSAEHDLSGFTGLVLNTAGTPSAKATNSCTNQFPRSDTSSGVWTCASIATADLPTVGVTKGGSGLTTVASNQIYVGTAADTLTAKTLPSCSNATTSKLLFDNATQTFSCGTDQTGAGGSMPKVVTTNVTNSTTTPADITGLSWSLAANTEYGFACTITHLGTATSGPRFNLNGPASPTTVAIRYQRATSATADTTSTLTAFSASAQTAAITSSGNTTVLVSKFNGVIINGANAGTAQFMLTSSTAGQTVTVYRGSFCDVY